MKPLTPATSITEVLYLPAFVHDKKYYSREFSPDFIEKRECLDSVLGFHIGHITDQIQSNDLLIETELVQIQRFHLPTFDKNKKVKKKRIKCKYPVENFIIGNEQVDVVRIQGKSFFFNFDSNFHEMLPVRFRDFYSCYFEVSLHGMFFHCNVFDLYKISKALTVRRSEADIYIDIND